MKFPPCPRHLTPAERQAVLSANARVSVETYAKQEGLTLTPDNRDRLECHYMTACKIAWAEENIAEVARGTLSHEARITELETQLAGAMKKIARLSRRLEESNHEA